MEHRWGERIAFDCPVQILLQDGGCGDGWVRNASISGALIDTSLNLQNYAAVSVRLDTGKGARRRTVELPACVARAGSGYIAVEWRDMAASTLIALLGEAGSEHASMQGGEPAFG
jgi:hypothetical protein